MNNLLGSWKTSLMGCGAGLFVIAGQAGKTGTPKDYLVLFGLAMCLALLGIFAQDHQDKSAEIEPKKEK